LATACLWLVSNGSRLCDKALRPGMYSFAFQAFLFLSLPLSITVGLVAKSGLSRQYVYDMFVNIIPSTVMLFIVWKRRFITLNEEADVNLERAAFMLDADSVRFAVAGMLITAPTKDSTELIDELHEGLTHTAPISTLLDLDLSVKLTEFSTTPETDSTLLQLVTPLFRAPGSLTGDVELGSEGDRSRLVITEELSPPAYVFALARYYITNVALPIMESAFAAHNERVEQLLIASQPDVSFVDVSRKSFFGEAADSEAQAKLADSCNKLTALYVDFLQMLRLVASNLPLEDTKAMLFKPSQMKKGWMLSCLSTNLHVHTTTFTPQHSVLGKSPVHTVASVIFGAPAAHSLGWKTGGLHALILKLDKGIDHFTDPDNYHGPDACLTLLELRYAAKAREVVVISQALGAVVTAAVELLTRAIRERRGDVLRQV
jgi:hypothetical protein